MKLLVVVSACIVLAIGEIDAIPFRRRPTESFAELVANRTAAMAAREEDPTTMSMLAYKSSSMFLAAFTLHIQLPVQHLITDVTYTATRFMTPDRALSDIEELEKITLRSLSSFDNERPADASAETNKLIDDFVNEYTESAAKVFENMHALSVKATEDIEPVTRNLIALIDALVLKIDSCLNIKALDFRQLFKCSRDYRAMENQITPELAELRSAADRLYTEYSKQWNDFQNELESKMQELRDQIYNQQPN